MPRSKFVRRSPVGGSFRVAKAKGMFDLVDLSEVVHVFDVDIPIEGRAWNIGLIVGSSGSGKTSIARECFPDCVLFEGFEWKASSMLDDFPADIPHDAVFSACSSVGLNSAPDWLKPYSVLSNGQRMRADMARLFCEYRAGEAIIYDEFTSVVDRQVACVTSSAVSKFVRRHGRRFIAVSCHRDVEPWLDPDWVYDTDAKAFNWRSLRGRPEIRLEIRRADPAEWPLFGPHHYLSDSHSSTATAFAADFNGTPVGWISYIQTAGLRNVKRIHRLVVRPDYQGLGIGTALLDWAGHRLKAEGKRVTITSSLTNFCRSLDRNPKWLLREAGHKLKYARTEGAKVAKRSILAACSANRITSRYVYIGS